MIKICSKILFLLNILVGFSVWAAVPSSDIKNKNKHKAVMPPVAFMQMQQQYSLEQKIDQKRLYIQNTEQEIARLSSELKRTASYLNLGLKKSMIRSKAMHEQNLNQAKIDLQDLEKLEGSFKKTIKK